MSIIVAILCIIGAYYETKSIKACFLAEATKAAWEQTFNFIVFVLLIIYIYLTQINVVITL